MDGVVSPETAIAIGQLGGVGVLNLEGLWTRYDDPEPILDEIAEQPPEKATLRMQELYDEPIKPELIGERIRQIKDAGVISCASVTPQRTEMLAPHMLAAELDLMVIQGTVVTAEHKSKSGEPLNLKQFVRRLEIPVIRRRVRQLRRRPSPHAHRGRGHPGGRRAGPSLHQPRRAGHRRAPSHRHRRRPGRPDAPSRRDRGCTCM